MSPTPFKINCWIRSEEAGEVFQVKIQKTDSVNDLQKVIMKDACLTGFPAYAIDLYKPKFPVSKPYKESLSKLILSKDGEFLFGDAVLSDLFPQPLPVDHIHVVVDAPSTIVCWVRGDALHDAFPLPISPGVRVEQLIASLKNARPMLTDVADFDFRMYMISGDQEKLRKSLEKPGDGELLPFGPLASKFLGVPVLDPLRVVVDCPTGDARKYPMSFEGRERKRKRIDDYTPGFMFLKGEAAHAPPSSLAEPSKFELLSGPLYRIACNRPSENDTVPLALYHEAFCIFKDRCKAPPTERAVAFLNELAPAACKWYQDENSRRSAIQSMFSNHLDIRFPEEKVPNTDCTTDGNLALIVMPAAVRDCENDSGHALNQVTLYYCRFLKEILRDDLHFYNFATSFPCLLLVDIGSSMAFYGAAFTGERVKVEPLARGLDLSTYSKENDRDGIASCFDAFVAAKENIEKHYSSLKAKARVSPAPSSIDVDIQHARKFPFLTSYNDDGMETSFTYTGRIDETKLVFAAIVNHPGSEECIVKFTSRYSEAAHEYLASHGMAPKIWRCIQISAEWIAVVMEMSMYRILYGTKLSEADEEKVKRKVTIIAQTLHAGGFVHGDIRDANLLIDLASLASDDVTVHLIDFDWAGRDGEVKYPAGVNCMTVKRPKGVKGGELITQQHDDEMVSNLFRKWPFYS